MAWRREADKRLSEAVTVLYTDACIRHLPRWVYEGIIIFCTISRIFCVNVFWRHVDSFNVCNRPCVDLFWYHWLFCIGLRAPSQYPGVRLSVGSRGVSGLQDLYLELYDRSEIWQALRQQCCRCACQIAVRYDDLGCRSRGFEALRDLAEGRLFGCWDGALVTCCLFLWCRVEPAGTEPRCWGSDPPGWVKWVQSPNQTRNGPEHGDVNKL